MLKLFALWLVAGIMLMGVAITAGMRINSTRSFPVGIYWAVGGYPKKGDLVFVKVEGIPIETDRGYINVAWSPVKHLLKRLVGVAGDRVTIDYFGVEVNGVCIPNSAPLVRDGGGRPLLAWLVNDYVLRAGEALILSDANPNSFDSRYFGPVPQRLIESVVIPILTL